MSSFMRKDLGNILNFAKQSFSPSVLKQNYCWNTNDAEEFRTLQIRPAQEVARKSFVRKPKYTTPREERMKFDQDWVSAWPGTRSFHPASVPIPVRQGRLVKGPLLSKYGNLELMKIPNFLHLTPPAITRHCAAIKRFCSEWPEGLETNEDMEKHFPIEITTTDYCHSSPTIRDPMARIVTLKVKLSSLPLDEHSRDKLIRLLEDRYNPKNDTLTIVTDRCPLRQQNTDYAKYLLTALFFESWKVEDWESEKALADMEMYVWDGSKAPRTLSALQQWSKDNPIDVDTAEPIDDANLNEIQAHYKKTLVEFRNIEETDEALQKYKEAAEKLLLGDLPEQVSNRQ